MDSTFSPKDWALENFGSVCLGDARRTARAVKLGASIVMKSGESLPVQTGVWSALKGGYRLLHQPRVTHEAISKPHWSLTLSRARSESKVVLFVQDRTELNYSGRSVQDLGFGQNGVGNALELQSVLCVSSDEKVQILGLAHQTVWTREHEPRKKTESRSARDARRKESDIWAEVLEAIGPAPLKGPSWVSIGDRESDIYTYMARARALNWHCLVRARHNRLIAGEEPSLLFDNVRSLPSRASTKLELRSRPDQPARNVNLNLAWKQVTLTPPQRIEGEPLSLWCIRVWEDAPDGLEWLLLSTLEVTGADQALEVIEWYRRRWLIEEYHKCLKTGCNIEQRQLADRHSLEALLGFLSIVAVLLLSMKATPKPEIPLQIKQALQALRKRKEDDPDGKQLLREIAMLGGFLARKGDGEPGWQTIWRGWSRLQDICIGMQLSDSLRCG